jgi:hypothetical protein
LIGLGAAQGKTIVRVITNQGELVVELGDPDIEVTVVQGGAKVIDKTKQRTFVLKAGRGGEVEFYDPETGVKAVTKTFEITRGGKTVVTASQTEVAAARSKPQPLSAAARQAILDLLRAGVSVKVIPPTAGQRERVPWNSAHQTLDIRDDERVYEVFIQVRPSGAHPLDFPAAWEALRRLPADAWDPDRRRLVIWGVTDEWLKDLGEIPGLRPVRLVDIDHSPRLGSESLALLGRFPKLACVELKNAPRVGDAGLRQLAALPQLTSVVVQDFPGVTEDGVRHLAALPRLNNLVLNRANLSPAALAPLRGRPLVYLEVNDNQAIDDTAIDHLVTIPTLTTVELQGTKVTADGVMRLKAALPKCEVYWRGLSAATQTAIRDLLWAGIEVKVKRHGPARAENPLRIPVSGAGQLDLRADDRVGQLFIWVRPPDARNPNFQNPLDSPAVWDALRRLPADAWDRGMRNLVVWWAINPEGFEAVMRTPALTATAAKQFERLTEVPGLRTVRNVDLTFTPLGDDSLALLNRFPELDGVVLVCSPAVGEAGIKHLAALPGLTRLQLVGTGGVPAGLAHLRGRPLTHLTLDDPRYDDRIVEHLAAIPTLDGIHLNRTRVTADGVGRLVAAVPRLKRLGLQEIDLTPGDLAALRGRPLTDLYLDGCARIDDTALDHLAAIPTLAVVSLGKTKVTADGIERLKAALPNCRIDWDGGVILPKKK